MAKIHTSDTVIVLTSCGLRGVHECVNFVVLGVARRVKSVNINENVMKACMNGLCEWRGTTFLRFWLYIRFKTGRF